MWLVSNRWFPRLSKMEFAEGCNALLTADAGWPSSGWHLPYAPEMVHRSGGCVFVAGALMAFASGCSDEAPDPVSDRDNAVGELVAVDERSLRPPGTEMGPGAEVQPGSALVGTSMPIVNFASGSETGAPVLGWQAVLVVEGDPIEVWDRYVTHLGLYDDRAFGVGSCIVQAFSASTPFGGEDEEPWPQRFLTAPPVEGENRLACYVDAARVRMALVVGAMPCLDYKVDEPPCPLHLVSHLYIRVLDAPQDQGPARFGTDRLNFGRNTIPSGAIVLPAFEEDQLVSRLPKEGERYDDGLDYFLDPASSSDDPMPISLVPEGGRSLVAPAILLYCNSGLVAVLEVPGSPVNAVDTFAQADPHNRFIRLEGVDANGRSWTGGAVSSAGGYGVTVVGVDAGNETSTVLVTECGD